jgi:fructose-1,6-bisphosphatase/inositol monophosphatase family enzyme
MSDVPGPTPGFGAAWSASRRRAPDANLRAWLELGLSACDAADEIALRWFRRDVPTSTKPDRTFVTEADQAIERLVRERIRAAHPDHGVVGEEYGEEAAGARIRWYVDPIDGTHNFIRGVPLFGTLLAVEVDGELQVGIMSAPALRERWQAARGMGAWEIGRDGAARPVRTSDVRRIDDAQLLYGSRRENVGSGLMPGFDARRLVARSRLRRLLGLRPGRGGCRRGDDRVRDAQVGCRGAARADRGGGRPGHRRHGCPANRRAVVRGLQRPPARRAAAAPDDRRVTTTGDDHRVTTAS